MTDPMYVGMVIVIAGYWKDVDQMLVRNAESENFRIESETVVVLQKTFVELKKLSNFGNGRDAVWMWKELLQYRVQRVVKEPEEERKITASDAEKAGEIVLVA
ncbi:hypothetical protein PsorP6_009270 [Peronosclerospora sorghi]|uniref:Uncharacterized protein n=1 Tax=Peronosclerospora sorghi TaxID=230839 RepID=A0ACC0W052_9STRA|nr:hypothetical protein PsorP6_009270 [Peronosclerospora sorghi]